MKMPTPESRVHITNKTLELLRYGVFICFAVLSLRFIAVYLCHLPLVLSVVGICGVLAVGIISWVRLSWVLFAFLAGIPFVSGLQTTGFIIPAPLLSFSFAVIYMTWFFRRVFWTKDSFEPQSVIGNIVDLLSALVMISLVMSFQPYPADFVLRRVWALSVLTQNDVFWGIDASYILLQGLFFYRILETEINDQKFWRPVIAILYAQATIIILFSLLHLIFHIPDTFHYKTFGVFSPFGDVHSYGSYLVFLLFVFLNLIRTGNGRQKTASTVFACFLAVFIAFSGSRITWITVVLIGLPFLFYLLGKRGRIILVSAIVVPLILINLFPGVLQRSNNGYLERFSTVVLFKGYFTRDVNTNLEGRLAWWTRSLNILEEQPATGIGIGSFYRVSLLYHGKEFNQRVHSHENAHNYYLQLATELGIPALLLFLGILFFTFKAGFRTLARSDSRGKGLVSGLLVGFGAYLITMLTNHPLILSNQQFLFWSIPAFLVTSYHASGEGNLWKGTRLYAHMLLGLLVLVTLAGYAHRIGKGGNLLGSSEYGYYEYDTTIGKGMRWTMKNSGIRVIAKTPLMRLKVFAAPHNIGEEGLSLDIFVNDVLLDRIHFRETGARTMYYPAPSLKGKVIDIKTCVSRTFNPYRLGLSQDMRKNREQGVAVAIGFCPAKEGSNI